MKTEQLSNKRQLQRNVLCYYLKVIDLESGKELGRVGDITSEGMMVFGNTIFDREKTYRVRVLLVNSVFDMSLGNLDVNVEIRWSKPDANPSIILTGMLFQDLDDNGKKIVRDLVKKIGIIRNPEEDFEEEDETAEMY